MLTLLLAAASFQGQAAPAPMMIFFDSGGHEIRREWEPVLEQAVRSASDGARLRITGHGDASGSSAVNRRTALRRAQKVADALVSKGVARTSLIVTSAGEEAPFIPTADGVREIQNRRVDISPER